MDELGSGTNRDVPEPILCGDAVSLLRKQFVQRVADFLGIRRPALSPSPGSFRRAADAPACRVLDQVVQNRLRLQPGHAASLHVLGEGAHCGPVQPVGVLVGQHPEGGGAGLERPSRAPLPSPFRTPCPESAEAPGWPCRSRCHCLGRDRLHRRAVGLAIRTPCPESPACWMRTGIGPSSAWMRGGCAGVGSARFADWAALAGCVDV